MNKSIFNILFICLFIISCSNYKIIDFYENHYDPHNECSQKINNPNNFYNFQQKINISHNSKTIKLFTKLFKPNKILIETIDVDVVIKRENREVQLKRSKIKVQKSNIKYYSNNDNILIYPINFTYKLKNSLINSDTILVNIKYQDVSNNFKTDKIRYLIVEK